MTAQPTGRPANPRAPGTRPVDAAAAIDDLKQASLAADMRYHFVAAARAGVPNHIGASLGDREEDVTDAVLVYAQPDEGVAEDPAHHRDAQGLTGENQAELNVRGRLPRMEHPRSHPLLSLVAGYTPFTF